VAFLKRVSITVFSIFSIFIIWIILDSIIDNSLILPEPLVVFDSIINIFTDRQSILSILHTLLRLVISLLVASILGFILGLLAGLKKGFSYFMNPIVTMLRTIPVISVIVIILIILGFDLAPYAITFLMLFPLIYQGIQSGITHIDKEFIDVYDLEDNNIFTKILHCYIPLIAKDIRTSLLQSLGLGIKVLVMSEYLAQTQQSIGNELYMAKTNIEFSEVFAWSFILITIALLFELIINHYRRIKINL